MLKKPACIWLCVFVVCGSVYAADGLETEITLDYYGKYIWRGQNISDDPVVQPGVSVGWDNLTAGFWGNLETTNINDNSGEFTEYDYSLDYSDDLPLLEGVGYSLGIINYYFPGAEDTTEVYWGFGFDVPLNPSVTVYHDLDEIKGTYASFSVGHSIDEIAELSADVPVGLDLGASLGWGSSSYNKGYWSSSVDSSKLNDLVLSAGFPMSFGDMVVTPNLNYVTLLSDDIRETDSYASGSDYFFAGINLYYAF